MNTWSFLQKYARLQHQVIFDKLTNLDFGLVCYSQGDTSIYWNHAIVNQLINKSQLAKIEKTLKKLGRQPTVYFENRPGLQGLVRFLTKQGYKKGFEDSWLFWDREELDHKHFSSARKVANQQDLDVFIKTLDACYVKDDPQNAYGELGEYVDLARNLWLKHQGSGRLEHFLVYQKDKPVAVSSLTSAKGIGYFSNIGSLPVVRGQGYGKAATLYALQESHQKGNQDHCLATEEGTYAHRFYKQIGFSTRFTALAYTKKR
ncbi:GNAT family N-acetyltransferase [Patescibacteria group bacterium]